MMHHHLPALNATQQDDAGVAGSDDDKQGAYLYILLMRVMLRHQVRRW